MKDLGEMWNLNLNHNITTNLKLQNPKHLKKTLNPKANGLILAALERKILVKCVLEKVFWQLSLERIFMQLTISIIMKTSITHKMGLSRLVSSWRSMGRGHLGWCCWWLGRGRGPIGKVCCQSLVWILLSPF